MGQLISAVATPSTSLSRGWARLLDIAFCRPKQARGQDIGSDRSGTKSKRIFTLSLQCFSLYSPISPAGIGVVRRCIVRTINSCNRDRLAKCDVGKTCPRFGQKQSRKQKLQGRNFNQRPALVANTRSYHVRYFIARVESCEVGILDFGSAMFRCLRPSW